MEDKKILANLDLNMSVAEIVELNAVEAFCAKHIGMKFKVILFIRR